MTFTNKKIAKYTFLVSAFIMLGLLAFYVAVYIENNPAAQAWVQSHGYWGIMVVAIVTGLNPFVPLPGGFFTPVFLEADFSMFEIITFLVIGTAIADVLGYLFGRFIRHSTADNPPPFIQTIENFLKNHPSLVVPVVSMYVAFAPMPNEILLLPLGIAGFSFWRLAPAIVIGNIIHQTILAFGAEKIFNALF